MPSTHDEDPTPVTTIGPTPASTLLDNPLVPDSSKGYASVLHFDKAPSWDILSSIITSNIIKGGCSRKALVVQRHQVNMVTPQANLIVGKPASLKDPKTYGDILGCLDKSHWLMAVEVELNNIKQHEVWLVAPLTPNVSPLDTTLVFKRKFDADGELLKYKSCLCVQGF
jgi:hypothetical protein